MGGKNPDYHPNILIFNIEVRNGGQALLYRPIRDLEKTEEDEVEKHRLEESPRQATKY